MLRERMGSRRQNVQSWLEAGRGRQLAGGRVLSLSTEPRLATQTPAKSIFTSLSNGETVLAKLVSADTLKRDMTIERSVTPSISTMKR